MSSAAPELDGFTVLDLTRVSPAARAPATLADYGAAVVEIGSTEAEMAKQRRGGIVE